MKNLLLSSALLTMCFYASAQTDPNAPPPMAPGQMPQVAPVVQQNPEFVQFKEISYDFGNVKQNVPPAHTFEFKNIGTRDITLVNVTASCGCTTPNWKGGVYKPQEIGQITATYNAASEGYFSKVVTVTTTEGVVTLTISGTVMLPVAYDEWKAKKDADDAASKAKEEATKKPVKKAGKKSAKSTKKPVEKSKLDADKPKEVKKGS